MTAEQGKFLARLHAIREESERMLAALHRHVMEENERILARLRTECAFDGLSLREQGSRYAVRIGASPLGPHLHLAGKGRLSPDLLRRSLKSPERLAAFVARVGIESGTPAEEA